MGGAAGRGCGGAAGVGATGGGGIGGMTAGLMAGVRAELSDSTAGSAPFRETVMTPPHTAHRARTDAPGTFPGSTR